MATAMTQEEVTEFLETQRTLVLATTRRSGSPVMHALWFTYLDGAIYVNIQSASFKSRNIRRDNRVCCLVEAGESYFELRGVMIEGRAVPVDDPEELARVQAAADRKAERIGSGTQELPAYFAESRRRRLQRGARVMLRVPLERVSSWDFGKARDHYRKAEAARATGVGSWAGRRVLVTGASSGIGAALARELAGAGAVVGICARREALLEEVLEDCRRSVPACRAWRVDLSELDGLGAFVARAERELGGIDTLVNNAGLALYGDAERTPWTDIERLVRLDYLSPVRLTLAALPRMRASGSGQIAVISSMAARMSTPGEAAYAAAKAAASAFFEALAAELWDSGISVHLVHPALIDLAPGVDGDDSLAAAPDPATRIPAPVCARAIRRQLERGDLELYVPAGAREAVVQRARDPVASIQRMVDWYRRGSPH
jgi:short-subunit dehydrogenase/nitroimidazol reductase NimA-like FMN-containing flavoprotein (pyridoxamine 5'-phosphate oxidase superfamily)